MRAFIDPETGLITSTPPPGAIVPEEARPEPVLEQVTLPDGSVMMDLKGTLQDYMVLQLDANGKGAWSNEHNVVQVHEVGTLQGRPCIVLQLVALFRALDVRDEILSRYRMTVRIFFAGVVIAIVGATISSIVLAIEGG